MIFILDLDGTLVDSSSRHCLVLEEILFRYGINGFDCCDYLTYKAFGPSTFEYLSLHLGVEKDLAKAISFEWAKSIEDEEKVLLSDRLYSDSIDFLKTISKNHNTIVFLTCRQSKKVLLKELRSLGIFPYASRIIVCKPNNGASEKNKAVFDLLNGNKDKAVYIGDSEVDLLAAKNNNVIFFPLNRGFRNKLFWDERKIDSYSSFEQIINSPEFIISTV